MSCFGKIFRISTFGESHAKQVGVVIDGVPSRHKIDMEAIQKQLDRRRPGQSSISTDRNEKDRVEILCGVEDGITLGVPICMMVKNQDIRPNDYIFHPNSYIPRPSHADFSYYHKYGIHAKSGGGRSSARETIGRVIAGALAEQILSKYKIEIVAWVKQVGHLEMNNQRDITRDIVDQSLVRCPDPETSQNMIDYISQLKLEGNSVGGVVSCRIQNVPKGLGEPVFDKLEAQLAHAMLSIPATKAFEIGSGFKCASMLGSQHNDPFVLQNKNITCVKNDSGGTLGGISSGEDIYFNVAFKPPATIQLPQSTCDLQGNPTILQAKGRHDPCVVNRAIPIVESMAALVVLDNLLLQSTRNNF